MKKISEPENLLSPEVTEIFDAIDSDDDDSFPPFTLQAFNVNRAVEEDHD